MGYYKNDSYVVYKHTSPCGKSYIGITHLKPCLRWRNDGSGYKHCPVLYAAIKKYGFQNFYHEILFEGLTYEQACEKEKELIIKYNTLVPNGYNVDAGGYKGTTLMKKIIAFNEEKECRLFNSITDAASYVGKLPSTISHVIEKPKKCGGWFYIYAN